MGRLLLVRHGESEGNRDRSFTLTPDVPLTVTGREQARATAEWIAARYAPARLVSSPFVRARESAAILSARLGVGVEIEDAFRERSYGSLAGQPYAAAFRCPDYDPEVYWTWRPPGGGETLLEVAARAGTALDGLARLAPDADVVVVSHGAVMLALWQHAMGSWGERRAVRNAGIMMVEHLGTRYLGATKVGDD